MLDVKFLAGRFAVPATVAAVAIAGSVLLASVGNPAAAAECMNRGDLNERYCDADGDLVADLPADESQ